MRNWQNKIVSPVSTKALRGAIPNILLPHLFSPLKEKIRKIQGREMFSPLDALLQKIKFWGLWLICRWQSEWQSVWDWMLSQAVCSVAGVPWIRGSQLHSPTVPRKVQSATVPRIRYIRANDGGQPQGANQWRHHVVSTEILGQSLYDQFNLNSSQQVNQMNILMVKKFRQMNFEENWILFESVCWWYWREA